MNIKDYFDLLNISQDVWCYPSISKQGGYNVSFYPNKKQKLKLVGVQIASIKRDNNGHHFEVKAIAKDSGDDLNMSYHEMGSPEQEDLFPEISPAKKS